MGWGASYLLYAESEIKCLMLITRIRMNGIERPDFHSYAYSPNFIQLIN